jgi:hypothetical protein
VKAIYAQNPVHYNQLFPINKLVDLMAKLAAPEQME